MNQNLKILLVDDADFFLETEKAFLKNTPATVYSARNGAEALDMAVQYQPDLIYMDVQMPVMDGLTCLKHFKANPVLQKIPVIMVFTPTQKVTRELVDASPCDGVVTKPIDRSEFLGLGHRFLFQIERRDQRASCQVTVEVDLGDRVVQGTGIDISAGGLYVQFREKLPPCEECLLAFELPGASGESIRIRGLVRWVNQGFPRPHLGLPQGFGVQFVNMEKRFEEAVQTFVEQNR